MAPLKIKRHFMSGRPAPVLARSTPRVPISSLASSQRRLKQAGAAIASGAARYIDCRSEAELAGGVVPGSCSIPFPHNGNAEVVEPTEFLIDVELEGFGRDEPIFVGCRTGARPPWRRRS